MNEFLRRHAGAVLGILSGFDRVLFRGTLRALMYEGGIMGYLSGVSVLLKDFSEHSLEISMSCPFNLQFCHVQSRDPNSDPNLFKNCCSNPLRTKKNGFVSSEII